MKNESAPHPFPAAPPPKIRRAWSLRKLVLIGVAIGAGIAAAVVAVIINVIPFTQTAADIQAAKLEDELRNYIQVDFSVTGMEMSHYGGFANIDVAFVDETDMVFQGHSSWSASRFYGFGYGISSSCDFARVYDKYFDEDYETAFAEWDYTRTSYSRKIQVAEDDDLRALSALIADQLNAHSPSVASVPAYTYTIRPATMDVEVDDGAGGAYSIGYFDVPYQNGPRLTASEVYGQMQSGLGSFARYQERNQE